MIVAMDGKYRTKLGVKVYRVLCIDRNDTDMPVVVEWEGGDIHLYSSIGGFLKNNVEHPYDLVEMSEWDEFKIDDKVMVSDVGIQWERRHFAGVSVDGLPTVYQHWATSWSGKGYPVVIWQLCRKPTKEELK
jgi:hypothetical protein